MSWNQSIAENREKTQIKVFTKWMNTVLSKRDLEVKDLLTDLQNGVLLCHLFEEISGQKLPRYNKDPKKKMNPFMKVATLGVVLKPINEFIKSSFIGVQYGAERISKGDRLETLGLCWVLINKFVIPETEEKNTTAKKALLGWVQKVLEPYKNVEIRDFNKSWSNGLGFCALIHSFDHSLINYDSLTDKDARGNCELAFRVGWESLRIDPLLDPEDIVDAQKPDEKVVMTYIATLYHYFKSFTRDRLAKRAEIFESKVKKLLVFIEEASEKYKNVEFSDLTMITAEERFNELRAFLVEKDRWAALRAQINLDLARIQREQKKKRLKVYIPDESISLSGIEGRWTNLSHVVAKYGRALREAMSELRTQQGGLLEAYDQRAAQFIRKCADIQMGAEEDQDEERECQVLEEEFSALGDLYEEIKERGIEKSLTITNEEIRDARDAALFSLKGEINENIEDLVGFQTEKN